jgi:hypothetical protein
VQPQAGLTPFLRFGYWPVVVLSLLGAGLAAGIKRRYR